MARIIYVCPHDRSQGSAATRAVAAVCDRLQPDNLPVIPSRTMVSHGVVVGISGHSDLIDIKGCSLAAGFLLQPGNWEKPCSGRPDGSYALFRCDDSVVEIVTDELASRTVWYVLTEDMFIASTSQRAVVALLGSFEFNADAVPWMMAAGTLGPEQSWDRRIRCVRGATCMVLDRRSWTLTEHSEPVRFEPLPLSSHTHERRLTDVLRQAVGGVNVADRHWAIALSGGMDCRAILCLLRETQGLRAVTWGLRSSLNDPTNDASIARRLARYFDLEHKYFETDLETNSIERVFDRFIANGEGRVDHISGYADGFALWRELHELGVRGIVRGDEVFGQKLVNTPAGVRANYLPQWSDFPDLPPLTELGLRPQTIPDWLQQQKQESLSTWRDRIQQQYRTPYNYAALGDLKLPYVEIINPLLAGSIVNVVRGLPDKMRDDKALFRRVARALTPNIPFATSIAIQSGTGILGRPAVVEMLCDTLASSAFAAVLPPQLVAYARSGLVRSAVIGRPPTAQRVRRAIRIISPAWLIRLRRSRVTMTPAPGRNVLAFRAYLIERANRMFASDASASSASAAHG